jgi:hypothetical protein
MTLKIPNSFTGKQLKEAGTQVTSSSEPTVVGGQDQLEWDGCQSAEEAKLEWSGKRLPLLQVLLQLVS